jgi:hypothetical protein
MCDLALVAFLLHNSAGAVHQQGTFEWQIFVYPGWAALLGWNAHWIAETTSPNDMMTGHEACMQFSLFSQRITDASRTKGLLVPCLLCARIVMSLHLFSL